MPKQVRILLIAAIMLVAIGAVLFFAQPKNFHPDMNQAPSGKVLNLKLEPTNYDFGTISMKNGTVTKSFRILNDQSEDMELSSVYTSCMCTSAKFILDGAEYGPFGMQGHGVMKMLNRKLAAGQEAELLVTFDPNAHGPSGIGVIERTASIESTNGDIASVNIKANVTP